MSIDNLQDMLDWLLKNAPSMNHAIATDVRVILEYANHQITPLKPSLDFVQTIQKLEALSLNRAIAIQSFKNALPKCFCKNKEHSVSKVDDSMLNNVKNFADWDEPNYGCRARLNEEADVAHKSIDHAINSDRSLPKHGKAICLDALNASRSFVDSFVRHVDTTYRELRQAKCAEKRAWYLVLALGCRIFNDIAKDRLGKLGVMELKDPHQVATAVFHACFMIHQVMRQCQDIGLAKHPSIASECAKFICHNSQFETLEVLDAKIKGVETSLKEIDKKMSSNSKQLNSTAQKADDSKFKLSNLESRIAKLEKK